MVEKFVTVGGFQFAPEAEAARLCLEAEGIRAFIIDAEIVSMDWLVGNAVGYIKLQVPQSQAEQAMALLRQVSPRSRTESNAAGASTDGVCLACGEKLPESEPACAACGWSYADSVEKNPTAPASEGVEQPPEQNTTAPEIGEPDQQIGIVARDKETPKPITCFICGAEVPLNETVCPGCGKTYASRRVNPRQVNPPQDDWEDDTDDDDDDSETTRGMDRLRSLKRPLFILMLLPTFIFVGMISIAILDYILRAIFHWSPF